ncbi:polyribonucleotide nucleotidyltransferase [Sporomusa sphaeroides]|uniref:Polyribonucleotide nucleotidyltransferase n=1 Tax=Sporomusa sphaeroides DSM 2875 TaxID=1337886 RepID=A0ABM9W0V5_9FIRM|nr:polyribonucleotide nucleotidyltransferase [Sporomusa sphaeroides]OLS58212.1 polyribonucleotide nucleotidyltransferase [Sporomusa sphaeroides DSM 2875]CVK17601.1 Polyribonucleotide nucleotidyltransferase [Sporomusa sphaeroides DSM 2875]
MEKFQMELGGRTLVIESGKMAKQASGAVLVRYGDTAVLVAATQSAEPRPGIDFFPLTVDYEERLYSVGKIPGGFIKREGRPSEAAILAGRLIDRPLRPLFADGLRNDVHVVATVMSVDQNNPPDIPAMIGASCALGVSDIGFNGPIGGVRVGLLDGKLILNPTVEEQEKSELNLVVAGTKDAILMVEAGANELLEETMLEAILFGHEAIKEIVAFQEDIIAKIGKPKKEKPLYEVPADIDAAMRQFATEQLKVAVVNSDKHTREENIKQIKNEVVAHFLSLYPDNEKDINYMFQKILKEIVRKMITVDKIRPDGRQIEEVRPITCEVGLLARTHGSGLFTRGQTQVFTITTLGAIGDEQILDGLGVEESKRYMHHYNFPSFSVGETRPSRGPGRREIGHGALAERALLPVIPSETDFPYTIRLVSEVLESNGSSSMGSVCGSTLSLMDAGVPIKAPVSGVAMGLVKEGDHYTILTDIQGMEDALGDMDFKVAGTAKGVTAMQMDMKISGITKEIFEDALAQARRGRMHIMGRMLEAIAEPRKELSPFAPRIITMEIDPDKIRDVIGPGGKIIKKIIEETGVTIDIEDDGKVFIAAVDVEAGQKAVSIIESLVRSVEVGTTYTGKVTRIMNFGAFVEILPGKEGLVHISQLARERVAKVEDVVKIGDEIMVKVTEIDRQGRINLSRKELLKAEPPKENRPEVGE